MGKNIQYELFTEKFVPKKTTDDCYTPVNIYNCVRNFVVEKFGLEGCNIVRPFYPGGDYESYDYQENDVVIDNPPFSIMKQIVTFYQKKNIRFFLFAPALTLLNYAQRATCIIIGEALTYANGAKVASSFVSNLYDKEIVFCTEPELKRELVRENRKNELLEKKILKKYGHPKAVANAAIMQKYAGYGLTVYKENCYLIDGTAGGGKLFGKGVLLSDSVTDKLRELDKLREQDVHRYELSEKEKEIIKGLI